MAIDTKLIDELLTDYKKPEDIIGQNGLLKQLTKALLERALQAEMTAHLGYEKHAAAGDGSGNSRNGTSKKMLKGDFGELPLELPRDRNATFEPQIVAKHQTRFAGFDDKIISMYARGMTTREIQGHLEEIYNIEVSPALISEVTEAVLEEVKAWQGRPLDPVYPIVYLDALVVKIRDAGHVQNKAISVVIGVNMAGTKEVLGLWATANEGAKGSGAAPVTRRAVEKPGLRKPRGTRNRFPSVPPGPWKSRCEIPTFPPLRLRVCMGQLHKELDTATGRSSSTRDERWSKTGPDIYSARSMARTVSDSAISPTAMHPFSPASAPEPCSPECS